MSENTRKETQIPEHGFIVKARAHVEIRGMTEVLSFDETSVSLATTSGNMMIEGRELRVNVLDVKEGTVTVDGHIDSIYYQDNEPGDTSHGLFGRLFH
jgi:sporulation protein YabP